jgi:hypothetical protein
MRHQQKHLGSPSKNALDRGPRERSGFIPWKKNQGGLLVAEKPPTSRDASSRP